MAKGKEHTINTQHNLITELTDIKNSGAFIGGKSNNKRPSCKIEQKLDTGLDRNSR